MEGNENELKVDAGVLVEAGAVEIVGKLYVEGVDVKLGTEYDELLEGKPYGSNEL